LRKCRGRYGPDGQAHLIGLARTGISQAPPPPTRWSSRLGARVGSPFGLELLDLALKAEFSPPRASIRERAAPATTVAAEGADCGGDAAEDVGVGTHRHHSFQHLCGQWCWADDAPGCRKRSIEKVPAPPSRTARWIRGSNGRFPCQKSEGVGAALSSPALAHAPAAGAEAHLANSRAAK